MKNSLEDRIKSAFENYEEEYNPADWNGLKNKLDSKEKNSKITKNIIYSVITIAASCFVFSYFFYSNENTSDGFVETKAGREKNVKFQNKEKEVVQPSNNFSQSDTGKDVSDEIKTTGKEEKITSSETTKVIAKEKSFAPDQNPSSSNSTQKEESVPKNPVKDEKRLKTENNSFPAPKAAFRADNNLVCANSQVHFYPDNTDIPCEYRWDFGDGEYSGKQEPAHIYLNPGIYSVKLQVISLIDKSSDIQTMNDLITVNPVPVADFFWKINPENPEITFESTQEDIVEWKWDFGDKQFSSGQKPTHLYNKKGNFPVSLSMKNNYGCTVSTKKNIQVENDFNLLAPNAFSPNSDGKNDTWLPVALLNGDYTFSLTVLDKNGTIAFKTSSRNNPWDGRHEKTNEVVKSTDSFIWIAIVKDKNGVESTYKGEILITESNGK